MATSLILGFFDGVHIGHQAVINSAHAYADESVLVTFKSSPAEYFNREYKYIYPREKSLSKIKSLGVSQIIELDFNKIAGMSAQEYLEYLVKEFKPISISTGFNHTFGKNKSGNAVFLEDNANKYGYKYFCIPALIDENDIVSSTLIKKLLSVGEVERANRLLKSRFALRGVVTQGLQIGRTIGFPTANIEYSEQIVKLPFGVYCGKVNLASVSSCDDEYRVVLNWGIKPTVSSLAKPLLEAYIIGFEGDLYGQEIEIEIERRIRDEKRFNSLEDLKNQIKKDMEACLKL